MRSCRGSLGRSNPHMTYILLVWYVLVNGEVYSAREHRHRSGCAEDAAAFRHGKRDNVADILPSNMRGSVLHRRALCIPAGGPGA
jgi:hypothetical protein